MQFHKAEEDDKGELRGKLRQVIVSMYFEKDFSYWSSSKNDVQKRIFELNPQSKSKTSMIEQTCSSARAHNLLQKNYSFCCQMLLYNTPWFLRKTKPENKSKVNFKN